MSDINDIGFLIKQISDHLVKNANRQMAEKNITFSQMQMLNLLCSAENSYMTLKQLEAELNVSAPTVVGLVSRLKEKGFAETSSSEKNRRITLVSATENGRRVCRNSEEDRKINEGISS